MKRTLIFLSALAVILTMVVMVATQTLKAQEEADKCIACHKEKTPAIVADWESSAHAKATSKRATCQKCHGSEHDSEANKNLAKMPTASTCKTCHIKQYKQYSNGKHSYSLEDAKDPEMCAACHVGFDHPQWEMWKHSKHGLAYKGKDGKTRAPSCQTCHMPDSDHENITAWSFLAVRVQETDKEWATDRAEILKAFGVIDTAGKPTALFPLIEKLKLARTTKESFDALREKQITTCRKCHAESMVRERFVIYDQVLREADRIFAKAIKLVAGLYQDGLIKQREGTPVVGYPFVLDFYDVNTAIEQKLFFMYEEYRNRTYQGAFHDNWDYMHWEGYSKMRKTLVEMEEKAAEMRAKAK